MWRRGWCRNPRLYSPQESQLVDQDSLDCNRGFGSQWEPADGSLVGARASARARRRPLLLFGAQTQLAPAGAPAGAGIIASSGFGPEGSGGSSDAPEAGSYRAARSSSPTGQERTVSFQPEERYWTDYIRIALPVIGLWLLLGLLWYWAAALIGGGSSNPAPSETALGEITPVNAPVPTVAASPTAPTIVAAPGTPPAVSEPINPTEPPRPTPEATSAAPAGTTNFPPGTMVVTTEEGVRMRSEPTTDSAIVEELAAGTPLRVTGPFEEAGTLDWWPVENPATGQSGFVREDFLREQ